jgi:ketosteroid isomerase-like protein
MNKLSYFFSIILVLAGCSGPDAGELMEVDRKFSAYSEINGMQQAFLEFADDTAVLLQANSMPVVGKRAILRSFNNFSDTGFILTWEPLAGDISSSGDLGYTYGIFTATLKADSSESKGKYVTIWKKQGDGSWKFVLDGGNEGI